MNSSKINVVGLIFQSTHGQHYYSKYYTTHCRTALTRSHYTLQNSEDQRKFERALREKVSTMNILSKLKPQETEIFSLGGFTVLFKLINELQIYLVCDEEENYFVMEGVINCVGKVLEMTTKEQWVGKAVYDHLDAIVIVTDEVLDEGIVVNLDPNVVFDRMKMRDAAEAGKKPDNKPQAAQGGGSTFSNIFGFAKNSLSRTLNLG